MFATGTVEFFKAARRNFFGGFLQQQSRSKLEAMKPEMKTKMNFRLLFFALLLLLPASARGEEATKPLPRLETFGAALEKLVAQEYPGAKAAVTQDSIDIAHQTRKFMIHLPLMTGEWQEAVAVEGPDRHGIMLHIEIHASPYDGQAVAPQVFNRRYFQSLLLAPEDKQCGCYLHATLNYPDDAKPEFIRDYTALVNGFGKYVAAK